MRKIKSLKTPKETMPEQQFIEPPTGNEGYEILSKAYSYIRFSTPEQLKGDSLRRQTDLSEQYAKQHGLVLDNSLKLQDLGLSAYSGANRDRGALGTFLQLIESRKIAKGSILIVESLDRLSREEVFVALEQFMGIIRNGIKIITLSDNREYDKNNLNAIDLVVSIMSMCRAHEESAMKALRLGKAWENKRNLASTKKLTARSPAWLKLNDTKTQFDIIEDRAEIIRKIFDMKLSGKGATAIIRELNGTNGIWMPESRDKRKVAENGSQEITKTKNEETTKVVVGWRESYVKKILHNRAVIGEYQPHRLSKGKREPVGEAILDYYPTIIDKDAFYRVQEQLRQNIHKGGQTGKISNLFSHIVKCGYCGGSFAYIDKGDSPKGGQYLICDKARRGLGCCKTSVKYSETERLVLTYCKGLHTQDILDKNDETAINLLKMKNEGIIGELISINKQIENIADSITTTEDKRVREILEKRMTERLNKQESLKQAKDNLQQKIDAESRSFESVQLTLDSQKELMSLLEKEKIGKKIIDLRLRLRNEIRKLIDRIVIYPAGLHFVTHEFAQKALEDLSEFFQEGTEEYSDIKKYYHDRLEHPKEFRLFKIFFKSGSTRTIYPAREQLGIPLSVDFDNEEKVIYLQNLRIDGRVICETWNRKGGTVKHYSISEGQNDKDFLHEIIDADSKKDNLIAKEAFRLVRSSVKV
jgi:DNA invertase Pin-like site-specific DNA recombinase